MKKFFTYTAIGLVSVVVLLAGAVYAFLNWSPATTWPVPPKPEVTAQLLERGHYLVENVAHCAHCHSPIDTKTFGMPPLPGQKYGGSYLMGRAQGLPGEMYTANLSPTQLGNYSDEELYRVITQGVAKDGHVLFPMMPYGAYGQMLPEDVWAMIAYLRTLPAVGAPQAEKGVTDFPVNLFVKLGQSKMEPKPMALTAASTPDQIGAYYSTIAGCQECHTPENERHEPDYANKLFAGGREFKLPDGGTLRTPNLTNDATGLGSWTEDQFVKTFKAYADSSYHPMPVQEGGFNTYMAWHHFSHMEETHLRAIFAFIRKAPAQKNVVQRWQAAM